MKLLEATQLRNVKVSKAPASLRRAGRGTHCNVSHCNLGHGNVGHCNVTHCGAPNARR